MRPAIVVPAITHLVEEGRELVAALRQAEGEAAQLEKRLASTREASQMRRIELGQALLRARDQLPRRGTRENGWGAYLEAIEVDEATAWRYMKLAANPSDAIFQAEPLKDSEFGPSDVPPPADADEPPCSEPYSDERSHERGLRDGWCTPAQIADALPEVDLDPCSNPRSLVRARTTYSLEAGQNGLELPWFGLVYTNGPYSNLLPFAEKLDAERANVTGAGFLVNADNSPAWWRALIRHLHLRLDFDERQQFVPPPGVDPSKNDRPQTLLMDKAFWRACDQRALLKLGTLWIKQPKKGVKQ